VDIVTVGCVASERTTDAEQFIVRVSDNTEYGHASTYMNQLYRLWEFRPEGSDIYELQTNL
jgi:hypothetical protein